MVECLFFLNTYIPLHLLRQLIKTLAGENEDDLSITTSPERLQYESKQFYWLFDKLSCGYLDKSFFVEWPVFYQGFDKAFNEQLLHY